MGFHLCEICTIGKCIGASHCHGLGRGKNGAYNFMGMGFPAGQRKILELNSGECTKC